MYNSPGSTGFGLSLPPPQIQPQGSLGAPATQGPFVFYASPPDDPETTADSSTEAPNVKTRDVKVAKKKKRGCC